MKVYINESRPNTQDIWGIDKNWKRITLSYDSDNYEILNLKKDYGVLRTKTKEQYKVYILEDLGNLIGSFVFNANNGFILVDENVLYTGADTTITKTEVYR